MEQYIFEWVDFGGNKIEDGSELHYCSSIEQIQKIAKRILSELKEGDVTVSLYKRVYTVDDEREIFFLKEHRNDK